MSRAWWTRAVCERVCVCAVGEERKGDRLSKMGGDIHALKHRF